MIDADLDRRLVECQELVQAWRGFLELVNRAAKTEEPLTPQLEQTFLSTKARIAMLHDSFMASIKEDKKTGSAMLDIVNRAITLKLIKKANEAETKKLELEWHEVFLLLNETVTNLQDKQAELADINEFNHKMGKIKENLFTTIKSFLLSIWFKIIAFVVVVVFVVFGVPAFGIYDYDDLRDYGAARSVLGPIFAGARSSGLYDSPYIDIAQFNEQMTSEPKPGATIKTDTLKKDETVDDFILALMPVHDGSQADRDLMVEQFKDAEQFQAYKVTGDGNNRPEAFLHVFWFRRTSDAIELETRFNTHQEKIPETFSVYRKINVIVTVYSQRPTYLDHVKQQIIDDTHPFSI